MKKNKKKIENKQSVSASVIVFVFLLFISLVVLTVIYSANYKTGTKRFFDSKNTVIKNDLASLIEKQKDTDSVISKSISEGYTFKNPKVIKNPYEISPLSAVIIFNTDDFKSITVSINDTEIFKTEESKTHVIPVYGLYANSKNFIKMELDDQVNEIEISTNPYDNNLDEFEIKNIIDNKTHLFLVGSLNSDKSSLRAFDKNKNLVLYMRYGKFTNFNIVDNKVFVEYKESDNYPGVTLEMDYLGKIYSITSTNDFKIKESNLNIVDKEYIYIPYNLYPEVQQNLKVRDVYDTDSNTSKESIYFNDLEKELDESNVYTKDYSIYAVYNYIYFDFPDSVDELLIVTEDNKYVYSYSIKNINMIKHDIKNKKAIFIKEDGKIYRLLQIIE